MIESANTPFLAIVGTFAAIIGAGVAVISLRFAVRSSSEASQIAQRTVSEIEAASKRALQAQVTGEITAAVHEARRLEASVKQMSSELLRILVPVANFEKERRIAVQAWHSEGKLPLTLEETFLEGTNPGAGIDAYMARESNTVLHFRVVKGALTDNAARFYKDAQEREEAIFENEAERPRATRSIDELEGDLIWCSRTRAKIADNGQAARELLAMARRLVAGEDSGL